MMISTFFWKIINRLRIFWNYLYRKYNTIKLKNEINKILKNKKMKIVIISDRDGFKLLKKSELSNKYKNIFFSKQFENSFVEDGYIILNSKKYYQFKGTSIGMFAEFSNLNFEIYHNYKDFGIFAEKVLRSDLYFNYQKKIKNVWSLKNQKFCNMQLGLNNN